MTTGGGDEPTFADVLNGLTFGGRRNRRARPDRADSQATPAIRDASASLDKPGGRMAPGGRGATGGGDASAGCDAPDGRVVPGGRDGFGASGSGAGGRERVGTGRWDVAAHVGGGGGHGGHDPGGGHGQDGTHGPGDLDGGGGYGAAPVAAIVRPYAWTRGRTRSSIELQVETLVSAIGVPGVGGPLEHRAIAELCRTPHSVAEVAAALAVPLGVAKVLVSDMAETGRLTVHRPAGDGTQAHYVLMERVLSGLRRL